MLKAFHLGVVFAVVLALFAFILARPLHFDIVLPQSSEIEPFLADEGPVRSERSANISHIIGISRKIQLIVNKVMFLQISPDGTVNGTDNDNDYTILQRASINNHQIKIQGVVTCNFLCLDRCGLLYGSKEFTDECIFNEMMESHHFNTYSSAKYSNDKRTLYLALNKKGIPRKVQTKAKAPLGKLETYTNVLPKPVPAERVEALALKVAKARTLLRKFLLKSGEDDLNGHHLLRHHRYQFCPYVPITKLDNNKLRCRKKEKRKKKRKCREDEDEEDDCLPGKRKTTKYEEDEDEEEWQKRLHTMRQKRKSRIGDSDSSAKSANDKDKKRKRRLKSEKKFSEKTLKSKCDSEGNCLKKKPGKNHRKEKSRTTSGEDPATAAILWRDALVATDPVRSFSPSTTTDSTTEKPTDDYEEDEPTEKTTDEDEEDASTEAADADADWTTTPPSSTSSSPPHPPPSSSSSAGN